MTNFNEVELGKTKIQFIDGDRSSRYPKRDEFVEEGIMFLNAESINSGSINKAAANYISEEKFSEIKKGRIKCGDLLLTTRGNGVGNVAYVNTNDLGLINAQMLILRANENEINSKFLFYYFSSTTLYSYIQNFASGSAQPQIPIRDLKKIPLFVPSLKNQEKIGAILSAYDDLIENNKKRIQILESIAEELYKEWFVRFRFPNYEKNEFEKGIPKDWKIINSGEFIDVVKGKSYTSLEIHDVFIDESLPFINLKNFNRGGGYRRNGLKFYSGRYADNQKTYPDDIVMAVTDMTQDRAVVGRVARVPKLNADFAIISLDCVKLVPKIYSSTFTYCYFKYSGFSEHIKEFANGANVLHLSPNQISKQKILLPHKELIENFEAIVSPIFTYLNILEESNEKLEIMRNNLLPRLISGKLSVEDLDIQFPISMQEQ